VLDSARGKGYYRDGYRRVAVTSPGLYPIGIVAELLEMHPETLRVWDRQGLVRPKRRRGFRCYSDPDLQRLLFVKHLLDDEKFNLAGTRAYLKLYPCWASDACVPCHNSAEKKGKPCWMRPNTFCGVAADKAKLCTGCAERSGSNGGGPPHRLRERVWEAPVS
jgi:MerR family transcriptional regulator/heat shock protein HspR